MVAELARDQKRAMNMVPHLNHRQKYSACSSPDSFVYNESLQHSPSKCC